MDDSAILRRIWYPSNGSGWDTSITAMSPGLDSPQGVEQADREGGLHVGSFDLGRAAEATAASPEEITEEVVDVHASKVK